MTAYRPGPLNPTRYSELRYQHRGDHWRFVDADTQQGVGPFYSSESTLLADLDRYAWVCWGLGVAPVNGPCPLCGHTAGGGSCD
jgi:hypothetical protein